MLKGVEVKVFLIHALRLRPQNPRGNASSKGGLRSGRDPVNLGEASGATEGEVRSSVDLGG
jgi:hypothetical protein